MKNSHYFIKGARNLSLLLIVGVVAALSPPRAVAAHTFHTSLMRMEYNADEKSVEISIQVFAHDLEEILGRRSGQTVRLDKTAGADKLGFKYLQQAVNLKNRAGEVKTFKWVGMESQADAVWLYVETKMPEGLTGAQISDRIFFDLVDDQVNLVHVKYENKKSDLVFKSGDEFKAIVEP